jgi:hypothetical protein
LVAETSRSIFVFRLHYSIFHSFTQAFLRAPPEIFSRFFAALNKEGAEKGKRYRRYEKNCKKFRLPLGK